MRGKHHPSWRRSQRERQAQPDRDERVKIDLGPETALRALQAVKPDDEPVDDDQAAKQDQEPGEAPWF